jgi:hypothetical protein
MWTMEISGTLSYQLCGGECHAKGFSMTPHTKKIGESGGAVNVHQDIVETSVPVTVYTKEFVDGGGSKSKKRWKIC